MMKGCVIGMGTKKGTRERWGDGVHPVIICGDEMVSLGNVVVVLILGLSHTIFGNGGHSTCSRNSSSNFILLFKFGHRKLHPFSHNLASIYSSLSYYH